MRWVFILFTLMTVCLTGCATQEPVDNRAPDTLYREAEAKVADRDFQEARDLLSQLRERYPFSPQAVEAELLAADIEFDSENYEAAAAAYKAFEDQHPFHRNLDRAIFRRAECQARRMDGEDRDQAPARSAADTFRRLLEARPDSPYAPEARRRLAEVRETLAAHELYVVRYYLRRDAFDAALERLATLAREYPESVALSQAVAEGLAVQAQEGRARAKEAASQEAPKEQPPPATPGDAPAR